MPTPSKLSTPIARRFRPLCPRKTSSRLSTEHFKTATLAALHENGSLRPILAWQFCLNLIQNAHRVGRKAKRRDSFWAVTPFLIVVTVLTPATTWTEGFTNRLIVDDYSEKFRGWQLNWKRKDRQRKNFAGLCF